MSDAIGWQLLAKETLIGIPSGRKFYIPPFSIEIPIFVGLVGVGVANPIASPTWFLGAWASSSLLFAPTGSDFPPVLDTSRRELRLGYLNLIPAPKLVFPWRLELDFPPWHQQVNVEVWACVGEPDGLNL